MKLSIKTHIHLSHPVVLLAKLLKILLITFQSKKGSKESDENLISSDNDRNGNNVVYILGDSLIKHVNGRNVSDSMNVKVNEPRYKRCGVTSHFPKTKKLLPKILRQGGDND